MTLARRPTLPPTAPQGAQPKPVAAALAAALLAGTPAGAMTLGDLALESGIGQPLRARVPLSLRPGENLGTACVGLTRPPPEAAGEYLTRATLDVTGNGREILISTPHAIQAPVLYLRLRAGCGADALTREYTVLLDPPAMKAAPAAAAAPAPPPRPAPAAPGAGWPLRPGDTARSIAAAIYPGAAALQEHLARAIVRANPQAFPHGSADQPATGTTMVMPDLRAVGVPRDVAPRPARAEAPPPPPPAPAPPAPQPRPEAEPPMPTAPALRGAEGMPVLRLKLSGLELDLGRASRVSADERAQLREAQQLMAAGDQAARYLQLRKHVAELEAQLEDLRRRAARPAPAPAAPAAPVAPAPAPAAAAPDLATPALVAGLGALLIAALYAGLRRFRRPAPVPAAPVPVPAVAAAAPAAAPEPAPPPPAPEPPPPAAPPEPRSVDAVLEEAQLFMIHGRPLRAMKLLEEQIERSPGEIRFWMLLFVILRSQKLPEEFAKLALRFRDTGPEPELWQNIQALGHDLDPGNPLYAGAASQPAPAAASAAAPAGGTAGLELPALDLALEDAPQGAAGEPVSLDLELPAAEPAAGDKEERRPY